jgi:MFS family permease
MSNPFRPLSRIWVAFPLCAFGFLIWTNTLRVRRVEYVSAIAEESMSKPTVDTFTPASYAGWQPRLILPEDDGISYEWLDQTRQMFVRREWRLHHIDYENAPFGREVYSASPYRWWLGVVAWLDQVISGHPPGPALEQAALFADPLLHLLFLGGATVFVAWQFGAYPAALLSIGLAALFPFAAGFLPGAPSDHGLVRACAFWSVLPLLAGIRIAHSAAANAGRRAQRWFLVAGFLGGLGLWISVTSEVLILIGIALGGLIAAWVNRGDAKGNPARGPLPWGVWALGGAATNLGVYLIEYFPAHLGSWHLRVNHPLYGLAWLGGGAVLARAVAWIERGRPSWSLREIVVFVLAVAALAAVPVAMWLSHSLGFLEVDLSSFRLTRLPDDLRETSIWTWLIDEFFTPKVWATVLPVFLVLPAGWLVLRRRTGMASRASLAVALGPVFVAIGFACRQLIWWNQVDAVLLALLVASTAAIDEAFNHRFTRWVWPGFVAPMFVLGAIQIVPPADAGMKNALRESEVMGLISRDLARWLAIHAGAERTVILAPHKETTALHYYGGVRGLATFGWENQDGLGAAVRILSAMTPEEAKELIDRREITHIIIPSWDPYLDVYARMGMGQLEGTVLKEWHDWNLPVWLRPVPYQLPTIAGFEGQSVTILEVVEDQDSAVALSRIAEYFVEMGQLDLAAWAGQALRRYPADLGALVARAQVEIARGDTASFDRTVELLRTLLSRGADRGLPWDRRVNLAVVLARGKHMDLARDQVRLCLAGIDEARLRGLTTGSLYRLQVLCRAFGVAIADQRLRELAQDLLPSELRSRL